MSKIVYFLLIVTLATLITARPADDKKPEDAAKAAKDAAKDATKDATDAADKGKDGAKDAAKKAEDALKDKAKDPAAAKKKPSISNIPNDIKEVVSGATDFFSDAVGGMFGMMGK